MVLLIYNANVIQHGEHSSVLLLAVKWLHTIYSVFSCDINVKLIHTPAVKDGLNGFAHGSTQQQSKNPLSQESN